MALLEVKASADFIQNYQLAPIPDYKTEFYNPANHLSFVEAGFAWLQARRALFPEPDNKSLDLLKPKIEDAVSSFDDRILSSRFDKISTALKDTSAIILWSQGNPQIQERKADIVKKAWRSEKYNIDPDFVTEEISEAKLELFSKVIMKGESRAEARGYHGTLPIVIIEDKVTNMMKIMRDYVSEGSEGDLAFPDISNLTEDKLDELSPDQFNEFLKLWSAFIKTHRNQFQRFHFIYVPPEKEIGLQLQDQSPTRSKRVREWLRVGNQALARNIIFPSLDDKFHHIDDYEILGDIIPKNAIALCDVDGPLVAQRNILETREENLRLALFEILDKKYKERFGLGFIDIVSFLYDKYNLQMIYPDSKGNIFGVRMNSKDLEWASPHLPPFPGGMILKRELGNSVIQLFNKDKSNPACRFDLSRFRQALESIGFKFYENDIIFPD